MITQHMIQNSAIITHGNQGISKQQNNTSKTEAWMSSFFQYSCDKFPTKNELYLPQFLQ